MLPTLSAGSDRRRAELDLETIQIAAAGGQKRLAHAIAQVHGVPPRHGCPPVNGANPSEVRIHPAADRRARGRTRYILLGMILEVTSESIRDIAAAVHAARKREPDIADPRRCREEGPRGDPAEEPDARARDERSAVAAQRAPAARVRPAPDDRREPTTPISPIASATALDTEDDLITLESERD